MRTSVRIAALLVGSALFVGCDKKTDTTTTPPATPAQAQTPPAPADVSKTTSAIDKAVDNGAAAAKSEADKLMSKAPTTAPAIPSMPAMPK